MPKNAKKCQKNAKKMPKIYRFKNL